MRHIQALFQDGLLRPTKPLSLRSGEKVELIVLRRPDPKRWNLERLASASPGEDAALAGQGLSAWAEALDQEDRS